MTRYRDVTHFQNGRGNIPVFRAQALQHGHGFGGFFRAIAPMAKKGLLSVGKSLLNAGARALEDVRDNQTSVKEAIKKQAVQTFKPSKIINRAGKRRTLITKSKSSKKKVARGAKKQKRISDAPRLK